MRIKEIKVEGLFGMFTHTIPLNLDSHLTIIYGENGIGKTMIFKILDFIFKIKSSKYISKLKELPFKQLLLQFETGSIMALSNDLATSYYLDADKNSEKITAERFIQTNEASGICFIDTQRLINFKLSESSNKIENKVTQYAHNLKAAITKKTEAYRKLSDDLKNSLSDRILSKNVKTDYTVTELQTLAKDVEDKRKELKEVGLISNGNNNFHIPNDIGDLDRAVLAVNVQDMQTQLEIYEKDNFHARLKLFIAILNERRLSYKKIQVSEAKGFLFINDNGEELKPSDLSSGEQHELVILYRLLFEIPENSLILIDEPEISLHITWQKAFISDMEDIIKLRNFDILIATHSPSIINGNWDLTVSLKGGRDEEKP